MPIGTPDPLDDLLNLFPSPSQSPVQPQAGLAADPLDELMNLFAKPAPEQYIAAADPRKVAEYQKVAETLSRTPPLGIGEHATAFKIPEQDQSLFLAIAEQQYKQDQTMKKSGYGARLATSAVQGAIDFGMPLAKMTGAVPSLDPVQERFKQELMGLREGIDPTIRPDTNMLGRGVQQVGRMAFPMVQSIGAGKAFGGAAKLAGMGNAATGVATAVGTSGSFLPQTADQTYTSLIGEGADPETATKITAVSAPIEAAIESILPDPFDGYGAALKGSARKVALNLLKKYTVNFTKELGEEGLQAVVNETAMEVSRQMDTAIPDKGFGNILMRGVTEMRDAALPLALMVAPGAAVGGASTARGSLERSSRLNFLKEFRAAESKNTLTDEEVAYLQQSFPDEVAAFTSAPNPSRSAFDRSGMPKPLKELGILPQFDSVRGRQAIWERLRQPVENVDSSPPETPDETQRNATVTQQEVQDSPVNQPIPPQFDATATQRNATQLPPLDAEVVEEATAAAPPVEVVPPVRSNAEIIAEYQSAVRAARRAGKTPPAASEEYKAAVLEQMKAVGKADEDVTPPVAPPAAQPVYDAEVVESPNSADATPAYDAEVVQESASPQPAEVASAPPVVASTSPESVPATTNKGRKKGKTSTAETPVPETIKAGPTPQESGEVTAESIEDGIAREFVGNVNAKIDEMVKWATNNGTRPIDKNWERKAVKRFAESELSSVMIGKQYGKRAAAKIAISKAESFESLRQAIGKLQETPVPPVVNKGKAAVEETLESMAVDQIEAEASSIAEGFERLKQESLRGKLIPATEAEVAAHLGGNSHTLTHERFVMAVRASEGRFDMDASSRNIHRQYVEAAIAAGKPVPPEVLADYPDLSSTEKPVNKGKSAPVEQVEKPEAVPETAVKRGSPGESTAVRKPPEKVGTRGQYAIPGMEQEAAEITAREERESSMRVRAEQVSEGTSADPRETSRWLLAIQGAIKAKIESGAENFERDDVLVQDDVSAAKPVIPRTGSYRTDKSREDTLDERVADFFDEEVESQMKDRKEYGGWKVGDVVAVEKYRGSIRVEESRPIESFSWDEGQVYANVDGDSITPSDLKKPTPVDEEEIDEPVAAAPSAKSPELLEPWQMKLDDYVNRELDIAQNDPNDSRYSGMKSWSSVPGGFKKWQDSQTATLTERWHDARDKAISEGKGVADKPGWMLSFDEYDRRYGNGRVEWFEDVSQAVKEGKPVPESVRKEAMQDPKQNAAPPATPTESRLGTWDRPRSVPSDSVPYWNSESDRLGKVLEDAESASNKAYAALENATKKYGPAHDKRQKAYDKASKIASDARDSYEPARDKWYVGRMEDAAEQTANVPMAIAARNYLLNKDSEWSSVARHNSRVEQEAASENMRKALDDLMPQAKSQEIDFAGKLPERDEQQAQDLAIADATAFLLGSPLMATNPAERLAMSLRRERLHVVRRNAIKEIEALQMKGDGAIFTAKVEKAYVADEIQRAIDEAKAHKSSYDSAQRALEQQEKFSRQADSERQKAFNESLLPDFSTIKVTPAKFLPDRHATEDKNVVSDGSSIVLFNDALPPKVQKEIAERGEYKSDQPKSKAQTDFLVRKFGEDGEQGSKLIAVEPSRTEVDSKGEKDRIPPKAYFEADDGGIVMLNGDQIGYLLNSGAVDRVTFPKMYGDSRATFWKGNVKVGIATGYESVSGLFDASAAKARFAQPPKPQVNKGRKTKPDSNAAQEPPKPAKKRGMKNSNPDMQAAIDEFDRKHAAKEDKSRYEMYKFGEYINRRATIWHYHKEGVYKVSGPNSEHNGYVEFEFTDPDAAIAKQNELENASREKYNQREYDDRMMSLAAFTADAPKPKKRSERKSESPSIPVPDPEAWEHVNKDTGDITFLRFLKQRFSLVKRKDSGKFVIGSGPGRPEPSYFSDKEKAFAVHEALERASREAMSLEEFQDAMMNPDGMGMLPDEEESPDPKPKKRSERKAEEAAEKKKVLDEKMRKLIDPSEPSMGLNPKKIAQAVDAAIAALEYGYIKFDELVSAAVESLGEVAVRELAPYLEQAARIAGFDDVTTVDEVLGKMTPKQVEQAVEESIQPSGDDLTSIKKAVVNEMRAQVGLPEMQGSTPQTVEEWAEQARATLAADPQAAVRLVNELAVNQRAIDQHDAMLLQFHYRGLANKLKPQVDAYFDAVDSKDSARIAAAARAVEAARAPMTEFEEIIHPMKESWGRTGVALQQLLRRDFSLEAILRRGREKNHGKPLTVEQTAELTAIAKQLEEMQAELDKKQKRAEELERELASKAQHQQVVDQAKSKGVVKKTVRRQKAEERVASAIDALRKKLIGRAGSNAPVDVLPEAIEAAKAYLDLGVVRFGEFLAHIKQQLGSVDEKVFRKAWEQVAADNPPVGFDMMTQAELSRDARRIQKLLVMEGMTDRDQVIDAVHKIMQEDLPEFTRRDTMDALSRYGQFQEQSQEPIAKTLRDMNAEILKLSQIDQQEIALKRVEELRAQGKTDEEIGNALQRENLLVASTGLVRDNPSDTVRNLTKIYNENKKSIPASSEDRAGLLQTSLSSIERSLLNRIRDLEWELTHGELIVSTPRQRPTSERIQQLEAERDALLKTHREMFPPKSKKLTEEQRLAAALSASEKAIQRLEQQLEKQDFDTNPRTKLSSPELDAARARLAQLRAQRKALQALELSEWEGEGGGTGKLKPRSKEEVARRIYEATLRKRIADYHATLAAGDFSPKAKKQPRELSPGELKLKRDMEDLRHKVLEKFAEYHLANLHGVAWGADKLKEAAHLSRALMTSFDMSALLRQGGLAAFGHPVLAKRALAETIADIARTFDKSKAFNKGEFQWDNLEQFLTGLDSRQAEFDFMHRLNDGPRGVFRQQAKLNLPATDEVITKQEEAFQGRWGKLVPGVAISSRMYTMILNKLRADLFDQMVDNLGRGGQVTMDEAKVIANFVNVATGRSDLGRFNGWASLLNTVFFAPRYVASRFQYLAMPFYLPFQGGIKNNWRVKRAILNEFARTVGGLATVLGGIGLLSALLWDDDDEERPRIELDPRSTDFLKVRIGETRIDFLAGLSQVFVLSTRMTMGSLGYGAIKSSVSGEVRKFNEGFNPQNQGTLLAHFARTKLAPIPGAITTYANNMENVVGQKETPLSLAQSMLFPMSFSDVGKTMEARGIPLGTSLWVLSLLGAGMNTYGPKTTYSAGTPEEREKQIEKDLKNLQWDDQDQPAYSEFLTPAQLQQFHQRHREKRGLVMFHATYHGNNEDELKTRDKNREYLKEMKAEGVSLSDARGLLRDYYRRKDSKGVRGQLTDEYRTRLSNLTRVYGQLDSGAEQNLPKRYIKK